MLRCSDGSYYVGQTDDLEKRVAEHQTGAVQGYTATRHPVELVYSAEFATRDEAVEREQQLKGWSRAKKEALIEGDWSRIHDLAKSRAGAMRRVLSAAIVLSLLACCFSACGAGADELCSKAVACGEFNGRVEQCQADLNGKLNGSHKNCIRSTLPCVYGCISVKCDAYVKCIDDCGDCSSKP